MKNIRSAWRSLYSEVLCKPLNLILALILAAFVFAFSVWLPNLELIRTIAASDRLDAVGKLSFLWHSLGAIGTNFSLLSATLVVLISILFGLNIALTISYFRKRITEQKAGGTSVAGMLAGLIGIGCASCGSVVLSTIFGVGATAAFTGFLPLGGQEFSVLGVAILLGSLYITGKKLADPLICKI